MLRQRSLQSCQEPMNFLSNFSRTAFRRGSFHITKVSVQPPCFRYPIYVGRPFTTNTDESAQKLKEALNYFRGNIEAGPEVDTRHFAVMKEAADKGNASAQLCVSFGYMMGKGVQQSNDSMMKYLMMGVEQKNIDCLLYAADIYFYGLGVVPDAEKCYQYYKAAADLGDAGAMSNVGLRLIAGTGVEKNVKEGMKHIVMSADKGDASGQYYAGLFYTNGLEGEFEPDDELSYHYLKAAAENGHSDAQFALGVQYYQGTSVVVQNSTKAFKYMKMAADQEHSKALYNLGQFHSEGSGTAVDLQEAFRCFQAAAAADGDARTFKKVGQCWMEGVGTNKDEEQGYWHYLKAAEMNDDGAQFKVAQCLAGGVGVTQNQEEALKYFTLAAAQGHSEAQYLVGLYHLEGRGGCSKSAEGAFVWLKMAADQGVPDAQRLVGDAYMTGEGVEKNEEEGRRYHNMLTQVKF